MPELEASTSRGNSSPAKSSSAPLTGIRSPTTIRTPAKSARFRDTSKTSRPIELKKRLLEVRESHLESVLPPTKRNKPSQIQLEAKHPFADALIAEDSIKELQAAKEDEDIDFDNQLHHRLKVARCLEVELLRENASMRLKAMHLKSDVAFYYKLLAKIELTAENASENDHEVDSKMKLKDLVRRIISAPKPVKEVVASAAVK